MNIFSLIDFLFLNYLRLCFVVNYCLYLNIDFNTVDVDFSKDVQLLLLLFADDTSLMSESKQGLQKSFGRLT